jgi:hypothetical protein
MLCREISKSIRCNSSVTAPKPKQHFATITKPVVKSIQSRDLSDCTPLKAQHIVTEKLFDFVISFFRSIAETELKI